MSVGGKKGFGVATYETLTAGDQKIFADLCLQIMDFGPSINTIDALIAVLRNEDLISVREEMQGRRTFIISLTEKGCAVAEHLNAIRRQFS